MELAGKEHLTHFQPMFHFYTLLKQKFFNPLSASVAFIWFLYEGNTGTLTFLNERSQNFLETTRDGDL